MAGRHTSLPRNESVTLTDCRQVETLDPTVTLFPRRRSAHPRTLRSRIAIWKVAAKIAEACPPSNRVPEPHRASPSPSRRHHRTKFLTHEQTRPCASCHHRAQRPARCTSRSSQSRRCRRPLVFPPAVEGHAGIILGRVVGTSRRSSRRTRRRLRLSPHGVNGAMDSQRALRSAPDRPALEVQSIRTPRRDVGCQRAARSLRSWACTRLACR